MNPRVDEFLIKDNKWRVEMEKLRMLLLESGLNEEMKWGQPCYTLQGGNVAIVHGFKEYCAILFVKGSLLKDPHGVLIQQTENVQAGRQIRFKNIQDIIGMEGILREYIQEAIEVEKAGLQVEHKTTADFKVSEELQKAFDGNPALKTAFEALTPGRQRAYLLYFSAPKQAKTREARVDKYTEQILSGKGLDD